VRECLLGVSLDEGFDEGGLANARWTDNSNNDWWRFFRQSIDQWNMEALFFDLWRYR
jgi:hypothetical protein